MIWFTLSLLSLAIFSKFAEADEIGFMVYAVESKNKPTMLYGIDFNLSEPKYFLNLTNKGKKSDKKTLGNIFLAEEHVYLSFKESNVVGRYNIHKDEYDEKSIGEVTDASLVGLGHKDALYMFDPNERRFIVNNFDDPTSESKLVKLKEANKKMPSIDVDPRKDRRYIFYAYCKAGATPVGKVFDVTDNILFPKYNQVLPKCFDMWRITPDGALAYAVKANKIYFTLKEGEEFVEYYSDKSKITAFAVGNTELFYTPAQGRKIIKVVKKSKKSIKGKKDKKELKVDGKVVAMALVEKSEFNTTPVLETSK